MLSSCARPFFLLLILLIPATPTLVADTLTGEVRGAVLDVDGNVPLKQVQMTLTNVDRGWVRNQMTDTFGNFAFLQLEPGNYTVAAEFDGYYRQEKTGVLIRLNQPKIVLPPFQLRKEVPTATQQITLQGEQTRTAVIDLTAPGPDPVILAYLSEPGMTSLVSLLDWAIRANYDASVLSALPLRGVRSFDQLALLSPGVFPVPFSSGTGPAVGIGVGSAGQFSVNGQRGRSNNFTVDGSDNNDEDIGVRRQGFVSLVPQSNESVQEFQVITGGFPAEFGRNSGAMVNAVSRSGQSAVHGEVYGLFNHHDFNSPDFFEHNFADRVNDGDLNGGSFRGNQFDQQLVGGVLGAPLVGEKLFFFGSIERQLSDAVSLGHFVVPGLQDRGLRTRNGTVPIEELREFLNARNVVFLDQGVPFLYSTLAGESVFSLYPLPNNPAGPFGENTYSQVRPRRQEGTVFSSKLDWYLSPAHSLAGRYNFTDDNSVIPFTGEAFNSTLATDTRTQNLSLFLNSTGSRFANAFRFSAGRTSLGFPVEGSSPLLFGSALGDPPPPEIANAPNIGRIIETPYGRFGPFGATGAIGQLSIIPFSTRGIDVFNFPQGRVSNTFQLSDFVTYSGGRHTLKFGFDFRRSQLNSFSDRNARPLLFFGHGQINASCLQSINCPFNLEGGFARGTDLASLGAAAGFLQAISGTGNADSTIGLNISQYDFFIQDDWKLANNFTLNLGLRYEYQPTPSERNRVIENALQFDAGQFPQADPAAGSARCTAILAGEAPDATLEEATNCRGNTAFLSAANALSEFLDGRSEIYDSDLTNFAPRVGFAWDPTSRGRTVIRAGLGLAYDANLGAVVSQSRNVFPRFVPINLDPNFNRPTGAVLSHPTFFEFSPTGAPLIAPGSINTLNFSGDQLAGRIGALFNQSSSELRVNGLAFTLPERDFKRSYGVHTLLSLQRQWTDTLVSSIEYVGSRGVHLTRFATPNGGLVTTPFLGFFPRRNIGVLEIRDRTPSVVFGEGRPFQGLGAFRLFSNSASSTYHSLQLSTEKRFSRGFEFRASWTWSHVIDEVSDPFEGRSFSALPQNTLQFGQERASANFDARHRVSFYTIWDLPSAHAFRLFQNWRLAAIGEFQSGQPFTVTSGHDRNGDGNLTDRLDTSQGLTLDSDSPRPIVLAAGTDPLSLLAPLGENGRVGRNTFRSDGLAVIDLAISRRFQLSESSWVQVRVETFNLLNHTSFAPPIRQIDSPGFGRAFDTRLQPRTVRFGVHFAF